MTYDICIVGGGFSGLMSLYHLVSAGHAGMRFCLVEPRTRAGAGAAYSTPHVHHVLNVPAGNMSALPDDAAHFLNWLQTPLAVSAMQTLGMAPRSWAAGDYVPRALYAFYIDDLYADLRRKAEAAGMTVDHLCTSATALRRDAASGAVVIDTAAGQEARASRVLLTVGNMPAGASADSRIVTDVFGFDYKTLADVTEPVVIIGSGLTMVDTLLSIRAGGYKGVVTAVSRGGRLPHIHDGIAYAAEGAGKALSASPQKLYTLMRAFRADVKASVAACGSWQPVFNHWRPYFPALWQGMSIRDRRRFFSRLFSIWNVHRHRMAAEIGEQVTRELANKTLRMLNGAVEVAAEQGHVSVSVNNDTIAAACVFDCRGPGYDLRRLPYPMIRQMLESGMAAAHETGFGLRAQNWRVLDAEGQAHEDIYAIGTPLIGERLETTAIPELRQQAKIIAGEILKDMAAQGKAQDIRQVV